MNRIALCSLIAITAAASIAHAGDVESARRKLHEGHKGGAAAAPATTAPTASATNEKFNIRVEYRGIVKKKADIGRAEMHCVTTGPNTFEVTLEGHAHTPDKKEEPIDFRALRKFKIEGNNLVVTGSDDKFQGAAEKYRAKILNMIGLAYVIKFRSNIYGGNMPAPVTYQVDDRKYQFSYARVRREGDHVEVTLTELTDGNKHIGKFFLEPSPAAPSPFRKFRIQTKEQLGINFLTI